MRVTPPQMTLHAIFCLLLKETNLMIQVKTKKHSERQMNTHTLSNAISGFLPESTLSLIDQGAPACVYGASKYLFDTAVQLGTNAGNAMGQFPEYLLNKAAECATGTNPRFDAYNTVVKPLLTQHNPLARINVAATKMIAPQVYEFSQEHASEDFCTFQAADLVGPAITLAFSSKKFSENALNACTKIKLLVSGKRSLIVKHALPTGCQTGTCTTNLYSQENFSTGKLLLGTTLDITFATAWFSLSQYAAQGILNAVSQANPQLAPNIIAAMRVGSVALPVVWSLARCLANRQPALKSEVAADLALPPESAEYSTTSSSETDQASSDADTSAENSPTTSSVTNLISGNVDSPAATLPANSSSDYDSADEVIIHSVTATHTNGPIPPFISTTSNKYSTSNSSGSYSSEEVGSNSEATSESQGPTDAQQDK